MKLWDAIKNFFLDDKPSLVEEMQQITEKEVVDEKEARIQRIEAEIKKELKQRKTRKTKRVSNN